MTNFSSITLDINRSIATVSLSRPQVLNALNAEQIIELTDAFNSLNQDDSIRVIILQGTGKSFCAGIDLKDMQRLATQTSGRIPNTIGQIALLFKTVYRCSKPVIGKLHGYVVGGGFGLCATCDIVIAAEDSTFSLPEVRIGIIPALIAPYTVSKIGLSHFRWLGITGETIGASRALEIGLVNEIVPIDKLESRVSEKAGQLLEASPNAIAQFKYFCRHLDTANIEELTAEIWNSTQGQEGIMALLEKRLPNWVTPD